ncbi:MAG TPA: tail fiber protein [Bryobacteraceae bacterium]|jgi:microcystin-dependent protein|nr:tail fiber protein [Bryobacteraceae bacterium]
MAEPFLGEIRMFGGNFAPTGWALCNGQLLPISQNTALFSILGTQFGGDGVRTFGLPDLRSRVPVHQGQGTGLSTYVVGEITGSENVTLNAQQMPAHNHLVNADGNGGGKNTPASNLPGTVAVNATEKIYSGNAGNTTMNQSMIQLAGGNQPHANIQPVLCVTFIIALQGIFPSRS